MSIEKMPIGIRRNDADPTRSVPDSGSTQQHCLWQSLNLSLFQKSRNGTTNQDQYSGLAARAPAADHPLLGPQSNSASEGCLPQIPLCLHIVQCLEEGPPEQADPPQRSRILPPAHEERHHRPVRQGILAKEYCERPREGEPVPVIS
jgi:hypothetical protein